MSDIRLRDYASIIRSTLNPRLSYCLTLVAAEQPSDPIAFLETHLRHLSLDISGPEKVNCLKCIGFFQSNNNTDSSILKWLNSHGETSKLVNEKKLILQIASQKYFQTSRWQDFDVDACWEDLRINLGETIHWWNIARNIVSINPPRIEPVENRKSWKTIRVFVSSTFKDFFSERDWLVKHVFPAFREWCSERRLFLAECDLRWGVPFESTSREILLACLAEIDRCREENVQPYFIGLLGERYGWTPRAAEFPEDLKRTYKWLPGISVTALEILTGALWDRNPNALMLFRNKKWLNKVTDESVRRDCADTAAESVTSLEKLKELVRLTLPPAQVAEYACKFSGGVEGHAEVTGLDGFGRRVLEFLKRRVAIQYPTVSHESLTNLELQHSEHETFLIQRSQACNFILLGRDEIVSKVHEYIENGPDSSWYLEHFSPGAFDERKQSGNRLIGFRAADTENTIPALVLSGAAGAGKSSLMAYCARLAAEEPDWKVVFHFVGATAGSTTLYRVLTRLWYECLDLPSAEIPTSFDELRTSLDTVFRRANNRLPEIRKKRIVIFIDAVNQMDDEGDTLELKWLPKMLPANVRLVVSALEGRSLNALRESHLPEIPVGPLTLEIRKRIVVEFLKVYNKRLSDVQLDKLLNKEDSGNPLWLSLACEDLRVFGQAELVSLKIDKMAADLFGIIQQIIERIISEQVVGGDLVQAALSLIRASRFGLFESELVELLAHCPLLPADAALSAVRRCYTPHDRSARRIPAETWAMVYLDVKQFLRPSAGTGAGRLDFYHRTFSKVANNMLLGVDAVKREWHNRLANYFENQCSNIARKCAELPFQLQALDEKERMKQFLLQKPVFLELFREDTKLQLLSYWRFVGDYDVAGEAYLEIFPKWLTDDQAAGKPFSERFRTGILLGSMLTEMGQFVRGEQLFRNLLAIIEGETGAESREAAEVHYQLLILFYTLGKKYIYGVRKDQRARAAEAAESCIQLVKRYWPEDSVFYAQATAQASNFINGSERKTLREKALAIFEQNKYMRGVVEVNTLLGVANQYDADQSVPRNFFEKALKISFAEFGKNHELTARAFQLYAQTLWNRRLNIQQECTIEQLEESFIYYRTEKEITEQLYGVAHPLAVRSREDCIIILRDHLLGHEEELKEFLRVQAEAKKAEDADIDKADK